MTDFITGHVLVCMFFDLLEFKRLG